MYNLYFQINQKAPELQGTFETEDEALEYMEYLIKTKSSIPNRFYRRFWESDGMTKVDYGAHNAFYLIEEISDEI